tara:strand:+ start:360 stop:581 length:222 start_codon:yes stop_codon:yes gene_type:complete
MAQVVIPYPSQRKQRFLVTLGDVVFVEGRDADDFELFTMTTATKPKLPTRRREAENGILQPAAMLVAALQWAD